MSELTITEIIASELPDWLSDELEQMQRVNGHLRMDKLSVNAKDYIDKLADKVIEKVQLGDNAISGRDSKIMSGAVPVLVDGLKVYLEASDQCCAPLHITELKPELLKLYNACAEFVRAYNVAALEHGDCPTVSMKEQDKPVQTH